VDELRPTHDLCQCLQVQSCLLALELVLSRWPRNGNAAAADSVQSISAWCKLLPRRGAKPSQTNRFCLSHTCAIGSSGYRTPTLFRFCVLPFLKSTT
jgi:hypothetical protein